MIFAGGITVAYLGRTSHEVRGLKLPYSFFDNDVLPSHLTRGAWIEMLGMQRNSPYLFVAPHTRCVD